MFTVFIIMQFEQKLLYLCIAKHIINIIELKKNRLKKVIINRLRIYDIMMFLLA